MIFHSLQFAFFFISVVTLYFAIPHRYRWVLLLIASYFFYMCWNWKYIILIIFSTVVHYIAGSQMSRLTDKRKRLKYLILCLCTTVGILFIFKYYNFFSNSLNGTFRALELPWSLASLNVLLPVGISFYSFQTLSYAFDVYRGDIRHEKHPGLFALYVSFFPQLVAGPIERATTLLPQFYRENEFNETRIVSGLRLMLWGLFKKIVVANRLAVYVDAVYGNFALHSGTTLMMATYMYAFQIYCDFSGYSDIAIGAARVLGYNLSQNFSRPYFSKNVTEFWRRWHISLSTWFRDYLYIPLGGNHLGYARMLFNLMVVFVVSGLWHGANWTFLVWGAIHGVYAIAAKLKVPWRDRLVERFRLAPPLLSALRMIITFHLVCLAWIYFRATSIVDANLILWRIFTLPGQLFVPALDQFVYGLFAILVVIAVDAAIESKQFVHRYLLQRRTRRWGVYIIVIIIIVLIGVFDESQFIYFQF
ncbi:MBOAT family protein [candidate division KSB1 bacterium]|nr:MBOAT family protein [candidate division KSB1 bacterium]